MNYKIVEKINKKYIEVKKPFTCESDVLDVIGICISNDIKLLLLREEVFTEEFINLKQGLAGMVLQKFINYHIKVSATIEDISTIQGKFKELLNELNKSNDFRVFDNMKDAENWILNIK
ncbi:DUF4180 domain-containing protein [Clostridioides mangenotii]|uniref:DUF4180 domain-containing protein n=1 Tax=Metaclostridioides mangenotii TaxID=1540 RepID=UPI001C0FED2F|nr:DUF4180 domain-containing protein [Clostridioides mangenotii]MBU5308345.1 DUF4180 domain-containing protein [Clostridioides mangenotii]